MDTSVFKVSERLISTPILRPSDIGHVLLEAELAVFGEPSCSLLGELFTVSL